MRLGLITGEYPPMQGGVGDFTRLLARTLTAQGHTVFVLTHPSASREAGFEIAGQVRGWGPRALALARRWARDNHLDAINLQFETAAFRMSPFVHFLPDALKPIPVVTTFHDLHVPYLFPKAGPLRSWILHRLARASAGVIVTNGADLTRLQAAKGIKTLAQIPIGATVVVEPPSDFNRESWRRRFNVPLEAFLIGYFGFMNATKGVDTLLDGLALAVPQNPQAHVVLIGGQTGTSDPTNAPYARLIEAQIERLGLAARVHWTGFLSDSEVGAALIGCEVIALPFKDGLSLRRSSFLVALAHGCPIITTRPAAPIPEIENAVYMIQPNSPADLAAALIDLMNSPVRRAELSARARTAAQQFNWATIGQRTVEFIKRCISATLDSN